MAQEDGKKGGYEIGYGKPPKHTQWQKGQSGNPSGKKTKAETIEATLKKLSAKEIVVHDKGVPVTMTQQEAMCSTVYVKAMNGDIPSAKFITSHLPSVEESQLPTASYKLTAADLAALESHADWVALKEQAYADLEAQADSPMPEVDGDVDPS